ncbi:MAG TPA: hypothetical protein VFG30_35225 [Polyangiales bacterium]|nr:hypothetical protein [Polyangiales bacterium]
MSPRTRAFATLFTTLCAAAIATRVNRAYADDPLCPVARTCGVPLHSDTARGIALGTGVRASSMSTSALAYNPAALVLGKLYHLEGVVDYSSSYSGAALGAAVVDSATSRIGAGIAFRGFLSGDVGVAGIDGRAGLAFPFSEQVSIGLGGRYLSLDADNVTAAGRSTETRLVKGFTMDASLRIAPIPALAIEAMAVNFIDLDSPYAPVYLGGSVAYTAASIATFGLDTLVDISTFDTAGVLIGGGVEFLIAQVAPIRLGYSFDTKRELHTLSGGAGYTDRAVGFDISIQQQLSNDKDTRVMGSVRYYVH